jgi:putative flippase GtrA
MGRIAESRHGPALAGRADLAQLLPARLRALIGIGPQLSRYGLVSLAALALDFSLYLALTSGDMKPVLAGVIGYATGTILHYGLSTRFVFDAAATDKVQARLFGEFVLSGIAGIGITALVIALATGAGLTALPAKVLAAGISFLAVFALRRLVVFAAPATGARAEAPQPAASAGPSR